MEAIILTKEQYDVLLTRLDAINKRIIEKQGNTPEKYLDNQDLLMLLKISKRTAQNWRDEGKISFSQVGGKIYYKHSDVEALLEKHYVKAFKNK